MVTEEETTSIQLGLDRLEQNWFMDEANYEKQQQVMEFLGINQYSEEGMDFANAAIDALIDERFVNFDEAYISVPTPDDNYNYQGPTALIPGILTLDNGNMVNIEFGVTGSDGKSANQEVAVHLIDGLKFALNEANGNLSSSEKITEIYIMATTNGHHSETSNHYNGTAMDISRINGVKMAISGITDQIVQLQKAFDDYQYVTENYGPYFKHKYFIGSGT